MSRPCRSYCQSTSLCSTMIVVRTVPGTKLNAALAGAVVAFQTDFSDMSTGDAWSVLVRGFAHELTTTTISGKPSSSGCGRGPTTAATTGSFAREPDRDWPPPALSVVAFRSAVSISRPGSGLPIGDRRHRPWPLSGRTVDEREPHHVSYFLAPATRPSYWRGTVDLVPNHFSEVPSLLRTMTKCSLVIARCSPPDRHGYLSLGTNADYTASLIGRADRNHRPKSAHRPAQSLFPRTFASSPR